MKNQTAVEWLFQKLKKQQFLTESQIFIAKKMEKQQIADAFDYEADADMHDYSSGEQYYDCTFL
jgi:hypothetical protein